MCLYESILTENYKILTVIVARFYKISAFFRVFSVHFAVCFTTEYTEKAQNTEAKQD
jgi:hypothetical protein